MKRSRDISRVLKKISKLPAENIETLSQRQNMETFSLSQDVAEDGGNYLNGGKLLGEQDSLMET